MNTAISSQTICMYWKLISKSSDKNVVPYSDFDFADFSDYTSLQLRMLLPKPKHHQRIFFCLLLFNYIEINTEKLDIA